MIYIQEITALTKMTLITREKMKLTNFLVQQENGARGLLHVDANAWLGIIWNDTMRSDYYPDLVTLLKWAFELKCRIFYLEL